LFFYKIDASVTTKREVGEDFLWKLTPDTMYLTVVLKNSMKIEIRTVAEYMLVKSIYIGKNDNFSTLGNHIWNKIMVQKNEIYQYESFFTFKKLEDSSLIEFNLRKQVMENIIVSDFGKVSLKDRVLDLIKFIPYTE
jgi:hypothetical protein